MIVLFRGGDFEFDRHARIEVLDLLLFEISASIERKSMVAGSQASRADQACEAAIVIRNAAGDFLPGARRVKLFQDDAHARGRAAHARVQDMGGDGRHKQPILRAARRFCKLPQSQLRDIQLLRRGVF
jgi:hypothetical protein